MYCLVFCGCIPVKTKFTEVDLAWMPYQTGDTLIFASSDNKMDTSYIIERKLWYSASPTFELFKFNPHLGDIIYYNKNIFNLPKQESLIAIHKAEPKAKCSKYISYYNSTFFNNDSMCILNEKIIVNGKVYNDILIMRKKDKLTSTKQNELELMPKEIYWSRKEGLVKYFTYTGECWDLYYRSHLLPPETDSSKAGAFH